MHKLKIAATGLTGLIGSRIHELLKDEIDFVPLEEVSMDITDASAVHKTLHTTDFDILLHLAAFTDVDRAEVEKDLAYRVNVAGTKNVFETVQNMGKKLIHISTDFVFDGKNPPYFEDSTPNPISYYGQTKYKAERLVQGKAMIVRPSYPYRATFLAKKDLVRSIVDVLRSGKRMYGITDQIITLTFIDDIALALKHLSTHYKPEIYHVIGQDSLSGYDAIMTICEVFGFDKSKVGKTTFDEFYRGKAPRPRNSIIKSKKNNFYPMKTFREGLEEIKKQLEASSQAP
ncbi:MAG: SDR family oxidoreductase [Candidatus Paceibacterota bacterium]